MLRLAHLILSDGLNSESGDRRSADEVRRRISKAHHFVIDNCFEYLVSSNQEWSIKEYPSVITPFDSCWFEYCADPMFVKMRQSGLNAGFNNSLNGVLTTVRRDTSRNPVEIEFRYVHSAEFITPFLADMTATIRLNPDGTTASGVLFDNVPFAEVCYKATELRRINGDEYDCFEAVMLAASLAITVVSFAIGLCHCKNVKQIDQVADISALGKKWFKRNGNPQFTYKVLQIGDVKHRSSSGSDSQGGEPCTPKSLHIVRGHFATYTAEKPLFGHIVGTVWKPAHARGDIKAGAVVKDYSFKPEFVAEHADQLASNNPIGVQV